MDISVLGCEPVRPECPAGEDVRYDPLFDELQAEVDRASMPSMAGAVDWEKVVTVASRILSQKSKDLLVAGYLGVGLIYTRGIDGFALGLKVQRDLLEHHGAGLFPQRERGRLRSLEWWLEKSEHALKCMEASPLSPRQLAEMKEHLSKLGQLHAEMLPEAPSLKALHDFLANAAKSGVTEPPELQEEEKAPNAPPVPGESDARAPTATAPTPSAGTVSTSSTGTSSTGTSSIGTVLGVDDDLETALHQLRATARIVQARDVRHPLPYRLSRQAAWVAATMPPAHDGRTVVPPPPAALRSRIENLRCHPDTQVIISELEGQLTQCIFWLDLNRFEVEALANVEASEAAVEAIRQETSFLLQRLPGVQNLSFADGTPFADAETLRWLREESPATLGDGSKRPVPHPKPHGKPALVMANEAEVPAMVSSEGSLIEAVDRLQDHLKQSVSGRERLRWRLALCRLLLEGNKIMFAIPHLEKVLSDIADHRLEEYDPALALEGLELAWHGFNLQEDDGRKEKVQEMLHRIARIDAGEVLRIASGEDNSQL